MKQKSALQKGFTLIELLVVIGILSVLLAITIFAINPSRQFAQANNTQRRSDVSAILNAVSQYAADNKGALPPAISSTSTVVSNSGTNICNDLVPVYLAAMPVDPTAGSYTSCATYNTGYNIVKTATTSGSRVTVTAPAAELNQTITVIR